MVNVVLGYSIICRGSVMTADGVVKRVHVSAAMFSS
jgi:hypothetical protein